MWETQEDLFPKKHKERSFILVIFQIIKVFKEVLQKVSWNLRVGIHQADGVFRTFQEAGAIWAKVWSDGWLWETEDGLAWMQCRVWGRKGSSVRWLKRLARGSSQKVSVPCWQRWFYPVIHWKPVKVFKQLRHMIRFAFYKGLSSWDRKGIPGRKNSMDKMETLKVPGKLREL